MLLLTALITNRIKSGAANSLLLLISCFMATGHAIAEIHDVPYYSKSSQFTQVKISPDGKHLAVMMPVDGRNGVAILNTDTMEPTWIARFSGEKQIGEFHWVNSERIIARLELFRGWTEHPTSAGEWFAANVDGKKQENIYGYRAGGPQSRIKRAESVFGYGQVIDLLEDDPDNILMSSTPFSRVARRPSLIKVNVYNGKHKEVAISPIPSSTFLTDHSGRARFVAGSNDEGNIEIYYREDEDDDWTLLSKSSEEGGSIRPLAFVDENTVYIADDTGESITGVYTLNLKTGEKKLIYRNEIADPSNFWFTPNGRKLFAMEVQPSLPTYVYLDAESSDAQLLRQLLKAFPGQQVRLTSQTLDGKIAVIMVFSDRNPGTFYLFDKTKKQARHLAHSRPWVDPNESATVEPVEFSARDGMTIRGYLTLPAGKEAKNLPLVVNPHGGPHGPRDWWGYNPETQFLASRGIAVLQVNFRGSGGYGRDFEQAGYRKWGREIQYDIIDGTRHLIDKGIVDEKRICIYGGSFGGYSALQSPILEPDLFACAVGFVGVYDLEMLYTKGDIPTQEAGVSILEKYVGRDEAELREFSPIYHVDKLKTALFIVHGEEDPRAPIEHAYALRDALDEINYPYEWLVMDKEGHGFYNENNREKMYRRLFAFIEKHIQLDPPPAP